MGIPYSRQINQAFDQVTPLVAAGFRVLQTTRNISILLAVIQVLTVLLLGLILIVLLALLVSVNPHLEEQRDELVTPALQKVCEGSVRLGRGLAWLLWISVRAKCFVVRSLPSLVLCWVCVFGIWVTGGWRVGCAPTRGARWRSPPHTCPVALALYCAPIACARLPLPHVRRGISDLAPDADTSVA